MKVVITEEQFQRVILREDSMEMESEVDLWKKDLDGKLQ